MHGCLYTIDDILYSAESGLTYYTAQDYIDVIGDATHTNESFDSGCVTPAQSRECFDENSSGSLALDELIEKMDEYDNQECNEEIMKAERSYDSSVEVDDTQEVPHARQFTVNAADLDCCILPMKTKQLMRLSPSLQMASLVSYPVFVKGLEDNICAAKFGYKIMINRVTPEQKNQVAKGLNNHGISVMPHKSPYILTTSWLTIGLHILARVLMGGGINFIYLVVYGMKVPLCEVQQLLSVRKPCHPPPAKLDIGINVDCPFIPVFRMTPGYEGRIYLMFLSEYGFICKTLHLQDAHDVE